MLAVPAPLLSRRPPCPPKHTPRWGARNLPRPEPARKRGSRRSAARDQAPASFELLCQALPGLREDPQPVRDDKASSDEWDIRVVLGNGKGRAFEVCVRTVRRDTDGKRKDVDPKRPMG